TSTAAAGATIRSAGPRATGADTDAPSRERRHRPSSRSNRRPAASRSLGELRPRQGVENAFAGLRRLRCGNRPHAQRLAEPRPARLGALHAIGGTDLLLHAQAAGVAGLGRLDGFRRDAAGSLTLAEELHHPAFGLGKVAKQLAQLLAR